MIEKATGAETGGRVAHPEAELRRAHEGIARLRASLAAVVVGQGETVSQLLECLLAGGHALLEGLPGLGKTLLVRTLADALRLDFRRIQFTPDLLPADVTGTHVLVEDGRGGRAFRFERGPLFGHLVLADEINRATPKTQSALLEAMQEHAVTAGGERFALEEPFCVFATQNPIELEGTFPLPEAQLDRFLYKIRVGSPGRDDLVEVLRRTTGEPPAAAPAVLDAGEVRALQRLVREVPAAEPVLRHAAALVEATRPDSGVSPEAVRRYLRFGVSPRGAQALVLGAKARVMLAGGHHVAIDDLRAVAAPALRHRMLRNFAAEADGIEPDGIVQAVLEHVAPDGS